MDLKAHINEIMNEYEEMRTKARLLRDKRVRDVYNSVPEIEEIDNSVNQAGFENAKKIMEDPLNSEKYNAEFNQKLKELREKKIELIKEYNIPADYGEIEYQCPYCQDTGYVENKKCRCFTQKLINCAYRDSNLSESMQNEDFEHFSLDFYADKKAAGSKMTEKELMRHILNHCKMFCTNFSDYEKNLLFYGGTGVGKTFLSSAVAKSVLEQGRTVLYIRATRLFNIYDDYKFSRSDDKPVSALYEADLLIIDDLGTEFLSKTSVPFLFDLINDRLAKRKKMIISTNLSMQDMEKAYTRRFVSRLYESFDILEFCGRDIRIEKFKNY